MNSTSDLYTGSNSGSFGNAKTGQRQEIVKVKRENKSQLTPAYDLVAEIIEVEIKNVRSLDSLLVDSYTPEEQLRTELIARKRYLEYLKALKATLANQMREVR